MAGVPLEEYKEDEECPGRVTIEQDGKEEEEYTVEEILSKKKEGGVWKYHIKWYRWSHAYNTWEPASNLTHCREKLDEFEKEWKRKNGSKKKSIKTQKKAPGEDEVDAGTSQDGQQLDLVQGDAEDVKIELKDEQEIRKLDRMWLGYHYSKFRRTWKSTEEPVCIVGSAVYNSALETGSTNGKQAS